MITIITKVVNKNYCSKNHFLLFMESFSKRIQAIDEGLNDLIRLYKNLDNLDYILKTLDPVIKSIKAVETTLEQQTAVAEIIRKLVSERVSHK